MAIKTIKWFGLVTFAVGALVLAAPAAHAQSSGNVSPNGTLTASSNGAPFNNILQLTPATDGFNFSDGSAAFVSGAPITISGNNFPGFYAAYLFTLSTAVTEAATITLNNGGVGNLSTRIYSWGGSFLNGSSVSGAGQTSYQSWTTPFGAGSYSYIASSLLPSGSYVLEIRGTTAGNFGGSVSVTSVPEPESFALLALGLGLVGFFARKRKAAAALA